MEPTLVPPPITFKFLDSVAPGGRGNCQPRVASSHVIVPPLTSLLIIRPHAMPTPDIRAGTSQLSSRSLAPEVGPPGVPRVFSAIESGLDDEDPSPMSMVDPGPQEFIGPDHRLCGRDIEGSN